MPLLPRRGVSACLVRHKGSCYGGAAGDESEGAETAVRYLLALACLALGTLAFSSPAGAEKPQAITIQSWLLRLPDADRRHS